MIHASGFRNSAVLHDIIRSGQWTLPSSNHHHSQALDEWKSAFLEPNFDLNIEDQICWLDTTESKVTTNVIWDCIRSRGRNAYWAKFVWHKLHIPRYAFLSWIFCHGRAPTLDRLLNFGLVDNAQCLFCIAGTESQDHLLTQCAYTQYIWLHLSKFLHIPIKGTNWINLLAISEGMPSMDVKVLLVPSLNIFAYHVWRERNFRLHDKGVLGPKALLDAIILVLKCRLSSSAWFIKKTLKFPVFKNFCNM